MKEKTVKFNKASQRTLNIYWFNEDCIHNFVKAVEIIQEVETFSKFTQRKAVIDNTPGVPTKELERLEKIEAKKIEYFNNLLAPYKLHIEVGIYPSIVDEKGKHAIHLL